MKIQRMGIWLDWQCSTLCNDVAGCVSGFCTKKIDLFGVMTLFILARQLSAFPSVVLELNIIAARVISLRDLRAIMVTGVDLTCPSL